MKRKKTTMLPQIYQVVHDEKLIDSIEQIYSKNKESNDKILNLRENSQFNLNKDFIELKHNINFIKDL